MDLAVFSASGGTGSYRFTLAENQSGAILNAITGAYLAGDLAGTQDMVEVTDLGCIGLATATVDVVAPMTVRPSAATVRPEARFTFDVAGGSGSFAFSLLEAQSGGTVDEAGLYVAGSRDGDDRVLVRDTRTAEETTVVARVRLDAEMSLRPDRVVVPLGGRFALGVEGGSGSVRLTGDSSLVAIEDGTTLVGLAPGSATLTAEDAYLVPPDRLTLTVRVAPPLLAPSRRAGERLALNSVAALGDLDGDGFGDFALGRAEASITALRSGAVYLYRGAPADAPADRALGERPPSVLGSGTYDERFGQALTRGDFDGDGLTDLAVGAPFADIGGIDTGAVYIFRGVAAGLPASEPEWVLAGSSFDRLGTSLAACDFNGDQRIDLAVGATGAEDTRATPITFDQGAVFVFLGYPGGPLTSPDTRTYGKLPGGAGWQNTAALQLGAALAAGDIDNDGRCDLAASSTVYVPPGKTGAYGAVFVYRGTGPDATGAQGGLADVPARAYVEDSDDGVNDAFGRALAIGDLDGDRLADVVAAQVGHDVGALSDVGAAWIWRGGALDALPAALTPKTSADAVLLGESAFDSAAFDVAICDANDDGEVDLLLGVPGDEIPGGPSNTGAVWIYHGGAALPGGSASQIRPGPVGGESMGWLVGCVGDVDGDRRTDLLALNPNADREGLDVGAPFLLPGDSALPPFSLPAPARSSGSILGRSLALMDVDRDGWTDVIVGAPAADPILPVGSGFHSVNSGLVFVYRGGPEGPATTPAFTLGGFAMHGSSDHLGWSVANIGDFDGDLVDDLAVVARFEDAPATYSADLVAGSCTAAARNDSGAVYIYRGGSALAAPGALPAYVYFGPDAGRNIHLVAGRLDFDGDGRGDIVAASVSWLGGAGGTSTAGGAAFVRGGASPVAGKVVVLCDEAVIVRGDDANDNLGQSVVTLGDVDADGCDDVAIGADADDRPLSNEGAVWIIFGWGSSCSAGEPQRIVLRSAESSARAGGALAAGLLDADGIADLVVGGTGHRRGSDVVGAAWVVPGARVLSLRPAAAGLAVEAVVRTINEVGLPPLMVEGEVNEGLFGASLAIVPPIAGLSPSGMVAVGTPIGRVSGRSRSGGVLVFRAGSAGSGFSIDSSPVLSFGGENSPHDTYFGDALTADQLAGDRVYMVVGASRSNASGDPFTSVNEGGAYVAPLD